MRRWLVASVVGVVLMVALPVRPAAASDRYIAELGLGMAAIASNIFYVPAKMLYATGGGIVGGLGWILTGGNLEAAQNIWSPSLGGTWILSPEMLNGRRPILFSGETYERPGDRMVVEPRVEHR